MKYNYKLYDELWGDDEPYSQVQVLKETRILGNKVVRTIYYVYANINPTTYHTLKKNKEQIKDSMILKFLRDAEYRSKKEGYEWYLYSQETNNSKRANIIANQMIKVVIKMHELVMEFLNLKPLKRIITTTKNT